MKIQKPEKQNAALQVLRRITSPSMALAITMALGGAMADTRAANADNLPGMAAQPAEYFYTGKPYDADSGSYTFRYRNYDPEINRWTTADPSGFPDGANNQVYVNSKATFVVDPTGLDIRAIDMDLTVTHWKGTFIWSFEHNNEAAGTSINNQPGFTGWTGPGFEMTIAGVTYGVGVVAAESVIDNSNMETEMRGDVQWKRWIVDQRVEIYKKIILGGQLHSEFVAGRDNTIEGEWYE